MICTLQSVSYSQHKQVDQDIRDALDYGPSPSQTKQPDFKVMQQLNSAAQGKAGQDRGGQSRSGQHNVIPCVTEHAR